MKGETFRARKRREAAELASLPDKLARATEALERETIRADKAEAARARTAKVLGETRDTVKVLETRGADLETRGAALERQAAELEARILESSDRIAALRAELDARTAEAVELRTEVELRKAQISALEKQIADASPRSATADASGAGAPKTDPPKTADKGKK